MLDGSVIIQRRIQNPSNTYDGMFYKNIYRLSAVNYFRKISDSVIWQGFECASIIQ